VSASALRPRFPVFERVRRLKAALRIAHLRESHARARLELATHAGEDGEGTRLFFRERTNTWQERRLELEGKLENLESFDLWFSDVGDRS